MLRAVLTPEPFASDGGGRLTRARALVAVGKNSGLDHTLVSYGDNTSDNVQPVQGVQSVLHRRQERRSTKHHSPVKRPPT